MREGYGFRSVDKDMEISSTRHRDCGQNAHGVISAAGGESIGGGSVGSGYRDGAACNVVALASPIAHARGLAGTVAPPGAFIVSIFDPFGFFVLIFQ